MNDFLSAIRFLTIIPIKTKKGFKTISANSLVYFPVAGLSIGIILTITEKLLFAIGLNGVPLGIFIVIVSIILTGGLHLDGLSDTSDGLSSGKEKEDMLRIMRDPHSGVIGILSILSAILLKIALIASFPQTSMPLCLLLMCSISRWSMVLAISIFPYARLQGKAKIFSDEKNIKVLFMSLILTFIIIFFTSFFKGLISFFTASIAAYITGKTIASKIGGITGDVLGAINEISEILILLTLFIIL